MIRSLRYKAKLSPSAVRKANGQLALLCELWNAALEERKTHWEKARKSVTLYDQQKQLTEIRKIRPEFGEMDCHATRSALRRLDLAFKAFYRRCQAGQAPGFPRFRSRARYDSITFDTQGWKLDGNRLTLRGIGTLKLFLHRAIEGRVRSMTLRRDRCGDWWVTFACDGVPTRPLPSTGQSIGVDLGLASFLTTSSGEKVANPRHLQAREVRVRRAQRIVAKRKRGSSNRRRAVRLLAKRHRAAENARRDFHFKTARSLVERYDIIAVEDLNVSGLARGRLAKSVHDAGWAGFLHALAVKAEEAGRQIVAVDPRGTSQACSGCGVIVPKTLRDRTHSCICGLTMDRDQNAALNILARAGPVVSRSASKAAA